MELQNQIVKSLAELRGLAADQPQTVVWPAADAVQIEVDFTIVDSLSCAFRELRVSADPSTVTSFADLKVWAEAIAQRVTYLLERLSPLEHDVAAQCVLVRSNPPQSAPDRISYYEATIRSPGVVAVRRYVHETASASRHAVDLLMTHEVLARLLSDIVAGAPVPLSSETT